LDVEPERRAWGVVKQYLSNVEDVVSIKRKLGMTDPAL